MSTTNGRLEVAAAVAGVVGAWTLASLRVDDEAVLGQELVGHVHGSLQVSAAIVAEVYDQSFHSLAVELRQGSEHLRVCGLAEALDAHVADGVVEHVGRRDALGLYIVAGYREVLDALVAETHYADAHLSTLRSHQTVCRLLRRHLLSHERLSVDGHNLIACKESGTFRRSVLDDVLHLYGVLTDDKLYSYTGERALKVVVGRLHVLGTDVDGVRV